MAYALGFLTGDAYKAASPLVDDEQITTLEELLDHLDATFEDPNPTATAAAELKKMKQGGGAEFSAHYASF